MMKKVKRYAEGGYEDTDDYKNLQLAADREAVEYEGEKIAKPLREAAQSAKAEPLKMASFGEAFKEARGRGDKTFEYMGKKYTTEIAKPKAAKTKEEYVETPKSKSFAEKQEAAGEKMRGAYRGAAENIKRGARALIGMKKGGSVKASSASKRADGCAQRGKTKGRMV